MSGLVAVKSHSKPWSQSCWRQKGSNMNILNASINKSQRHDGAGFYLHLTHDKDSNNTFD